MRRSTVLCKNLVQRTLFQKSGLIPRQQMRSINTIINFVPQQEAWIIERFGKFHRIAEAGIHIVIPIFEQIYYYSIDLLG